MKYYISGNVPWELCDRQDDMPKLVHIYITSTGDNLKKKE